MHRTILCLGLLVSLAKVANASCNLAVTAEGSVEFNPFSSVNSSAIALAVLHRGTDYNNIKVKFGSPLNGSPSSTVINYPGYIVKNTSSTTVFNSALSAGSFPFIDHLARSLLSASHLKYVLTVTSPPQAGVDVASPPLSGKITLPVIVEGTDSTNTVCRITKNVDIPVNIPTQQSVALSNSFSFGSSSAELAAGVVGKLAPVTKRSKLYIWSNAKYKIQATSDNGGVMLREGGSNHAVNKLPYTLTFGTTTPLKLGQGDATVSSVQEGSTLVNGKQINIDFVTQD
ncbi:MAG: hypothetical protein ACPG47_09780, partial [Leucothrix sp.]